MFSLKVTGLSLRRSSKLIFRNLDINLYSGQILIVSGPNGAGKSSLLQTIAGFLRPFSGSINIQPITDNYIQTEYIHYLGHLNGLKSSLTLFETLSFWKEFYSNPKWPNSTTQAPETSYLETLSIEQIINKVGLYNLAHLPVRLLSSGQKKRLSFSRLLLNQRPLWLLDEPTTALDKEGKAMMITYIHEHVEKGGLVLMVSHETLNLEKATYIDFGELKQKQKP